MRDVGHVDPALGQHLNRQMTSKGYLEQRKLECAAPNHDLGDFPSVAKRTGKSDGNRRRVVSVLYKL